MTPRIEVTSCSSLGRKEMQRIEDWSTEDRIRDALERCLSDLAQDNPDKHLWNGVSFWCLNEFMKRNSQNVLVLLQQVLEKTKQVLEQCQYELVVPLTLLFSSALLRAPYISPDCGVLQDAYLVFHGFLAWPEPYFSACKLLLNTIQQELKAPGISFHRLIRSEQGVCPRMHSPKSIIVLLANPDGDDPLEVHEVFEQLNATQHSNREVSIILILHCFRAALSVTHDWKALLTTLQAKQTEELEMLAEKVTDLLETAASAADPCTARQGLLEGIEEIRASLDVTLTDCHNTGTVEPCRILPIPKYHTCYWEKYNFDFLNDILSDEPSFDSSEECFQKADDYHWHSCAYRLDDAMENKAGRSIVIASPSPTKSSCIPPSSSTVFGPSGVDIGEETKQEDMKGEHNIQMKPRKKPKKKSRSLLGVESLSFLLKAPLSPKCHRTQSLIYRADLKKSTQRRVEPVAPQKQVCFYRRPFLSCDEGSLEDTSTVVKVVIFGGNREVGRLAGAFCDLQEKKGQRPQLTQTCKLQFYFVPTKRSTGSPAKGHTVPGGQTGISEKPLPSGECSGSVLEKNTDEIAQMLGVKDPWYMRNVQSLFSLPPDVLCQAVGKGEDDTSLDNKMLPLLTDMVLYYCRHAEQSILLQLYQAKITLADGKKRKEVFVHSLELGHAAVIRAFKDMGAVNKRFGIDEEQKAVPSTLSVAYNKVVVSGRNQWKQTEVICTSMNLSKVYSGTENLRLTITKHRSKFRRGYTYVLVNQVQVKNTDDGKTFAVCLDQDEKRFIQGITKCVVSLCHKPISASDWRTCRPSSGHMQNLQPSGYSLLCLPINSFMASSS